MKRIGYLISLIGLVAIALTLEPAKKIILKIIPLTLPSQITNIYLTVGGLVLIIIGIMLIKSSGRGKLKKGEEIPIYQGKKIIGYRRR